jgi:hypothetical protein
MKEQLTFDDYENLFNGVLIKGSKGLVFIPEHNVNSKGVLVALAPKVVVNTSIDAINTAIAEAKTVNKPVFTKK